MTADAAQAARAGRAGRRARASPSWSATPSSSARRCARSRRLIDTRRAGRHLLHHHLAREPGPAPEGRQRRLGPRPARPLASSTTGSARRRAACSVTGRGVHQPRASPTWPSSTSRFPSGRRRRDPGCWLVAGQAAPHHRRRQQEDARLRRHRERREGQDLRPRRGLPASPTDFGEFQLSLPHRRHRRAQDRGHASRCSSRRSTSSTACATGDRPLTDGWAGLQVVASLEAAERSLRAGGCDECRSCRRVP